MGLHYRNLDGTTRNWMLEESNLGGHYDSPRLNAAGKASWVGLFNASLQHHNDDWLRDQLVGGAFFLTQEPYTRAGITRMRDINVPASALMLAEGEFNRYYLRGLSRRAIDEGHDHLVVYRAKVVSTPRPESEAKIGAQISPIELLNALRAADFVSVDAALAIPSGPNSGLSAHLPVK